MPYLDSYLWCTETGWSLDDWLSLPEPIKQHWLVYRETKIAAEQIRARRARSHGD